jgi:hypothetical protein
MPRYPELLIWVLVLALSPYFGGTASADDVHARKTVNLDGPWLLATDPDNVGRSEQWWKAPRPEAKQTRVPWIIQDAFPAYHGMAWYWREFSAPANPHVGGRYLLRFWQVDYKSDVWLNDVFVGEHEGPEDPFVFDVTDVIRPGATNRVAVRVLNPTDEPIEGIALEFVPHRNKTNHYKAGHSYNHGGIMDSVELLVTPAVRADDLWVRPDPSTGAIRIEARMHNSLPESASVSIDFTVAPANRGETLDVAAVETALAPGSSTVTSSLQVDQPKLWNLNDPNLYRVTARIRQTGGASIDELSTTCGFRDFRIEDGYFRLNGKRVFLRSSHTGNHCPIGLQLPHDPDLIRRDLLNLKIMGFNIVRFSLGVAVRSQLDLCDEIGLMVWEECFGGWYLRDSARAGSYFDESVAGMIRRDRNHPSITLWGLLNENFGGPLFFRAMDSLPMIRSLDDTRLVLLNDGRHDGLLEFGAWSNPGTTIWEDLCDISHPYRPVPHSAATLQLYRDSGRSGRPYFMSEYGIGSAVNLVRVVRQYEQNGGAHVEDHDFYREKLDRFLKDWERYDMQATFGRPEDYFDVAVGFMAHQREFGTNALRANPKCVGQGMSGAVDQGMSGEGLTSTFREPKPGTFDAVFDALAPLRWCLFVEPVNVYRGTEILLEAVLVNEDALPPGSYAARLEIFNDDNERVLDRLIAVNVPDNTTRPEPPFAMPVFSEKIVADFPTGQYRFRARFLEGGAATGGKADFYVTDPVDMPPVETEVVLWGENTELKKWLTAEQIAVRDFNPEVHDRREVIIVGDKSIGRDGRDIFRDLAQRIGRGSVVIFMSPKAFHKHFDWAGHHPEALGWLPLKSKGKVEIAYNPGIYRPDWWARTHPLMEGMPGDGLLGYTYYRDMLPDLAYVGIDKPAAAVIVSINASFDYWSGLTLSVHELGAGEFILNTMPIRKNLGKIPVAERLMRNILRYATSKTQGPIEELPADFDAELAKREI